MKNIESTEILVNKILRSYTLCDFCIGRLISKNLCLKPSRNLGVKFNSNTKKLGSKKCFICKNIFDKLNQVVQNMIENSTSYQFSTFLIGSVLKTSISDNDDIVRSKFKIKGVINVKTHINHEIAKKFSRQTKSKLDIIDPELTVKINFKDESCRIQSRSLFMYGRYTKGRRNIPQKQESCKNCQGRGCFSCDFHGLDNFNSVEGQIVKFVIKKFNSKQVKINWIGGEDKASLVLGNGRPFFIKIIDPHIRKLRIQKQNDLDGIKLHDLRQIKTQPKESVPFRSKVVALVKSELPLEDHLLEKLLMIKNTSLEIHNRGERIVKKSIYDIKYKKSNSNSLKISMFVDGGVPIRSFIENSSVQPNLTELLQNRCTCVQFDFKQINIMSNTSKN
jgi:tRNA pseudouridine synthase 10|tara:strand:- start:865 stop:2037 length:1173 start_codon:yes stop_codon:yes gene_type:complete